MNIHLLSILLASVIFLFVIDLVRRNKLTFKYALAWLLASALGVFFSVFHQYLFEFAKVLGFELPSNFIFFTLFCVFLLLALVLTVFLCQQNSRNDRMAQKIALLELEIKETKQKLTK